VWRYRFCGLIVDSDLELPQALPYDRETSTSDVRISSGKIPVSFPDAQAGGSNWQLAGDRYLFRVNGKVRFLVTGGREILYAPENGATANEATPYLTGGAFGVVLVQRGMMMLHAATVKVGDRAVALCGPTGAGKSTLAAKLECDGYPPVTDDICVIEANDFASVVRSDGHYLKLSGEAVVRLGIEDRRGRLIPGAKGKYALVPSTKDCTESLPLAAIYELRQAEDKNGLGIRTISATAGAAMLSRNYYHPTLIPKLKQQESFFLNSIRLMRHTRLFSLARPWGISMLDDTASQLKMHWKQLGLC
jgi:hypothetical protein